jgi:hypothetical protein
MAAERSLADRHRMLVQGTGRYGDNGIPQSLRPTSVNDASDGRSSIGGGVYAYGIAAAAPDRYQSRDSQGGGRQ